MKTKKKPEEFRIVDNFKCDYVMHKDGVGVIAKGAMGDYQDKYLFGAMPSEHNTPTGPPGSYIHFRNKEEVIDFAMRLLKAAGVGGTAEAIQDYKASNGNGSIVRVKDGLKKDIGMN